MFFIEIIFKMQKAKWGIMIENVSPPPSHIVGGQLLSLVSVSVKQEMAYNFKTFLILMYIVSYKIVSKKPNCKQSKI